MKSLYITTINPYLSLRSIYLIKLFNMHFSGVLAVIIIFLQVILINSFNYVSKYNRIFKLSMMASKYLGDKPVFVAGGSSGIGYELIKKLSALGTPVKVLVRRPDAKEDLEKLPGVTVEMGDALDESAVQKCMTGCVAAITTLGG